MNQHQPFTSADTAAIDAVLNSSPAGAEAARVDRVRRLLGLLDSPVAEHRAVLIDATLSRVLRARDHAAAEPELCPMDEEALDALIQAGFDPRQVPASLRARASHHRNLAELVTCGPALTSVNLVERTMSRVMDAAAPAPIPIEHARARVSSFRLADLVSIAAVLLLGASVVWPLLSGMRYNSTKTACLGNMAGLGGALSAYAATYRDQLPVATASMGEGRWWDVGSSKVTSNSANLFTLARTGYASLRQLACPGNRMAPTALPEAESRDWRDLQEVSYSYQIMFGDDQPSWHGPESFVVITDRSPVVLRAVKGEIIFPDENSPNHHRQGQHVLASDGSSRWMTNPELPSGDNIWLPRQVEELIRAARASAGIAPLQGRETPAAGDVFVGP